MLEVLILHVMVKVVIEVRVIDNVYIYMSMGPREEFSEGVMPLDICGMGRIKVLQLVIGFRDGQGLPYSVNGEVCDMEPGEFKDDILLATPHVVEEIFLGDPFDVCIEDAGVTDCTSFIHGLVYISDCDGGGKFFSGELVFSDKLPVDAWDVGTRVY